MAAPSVETCNQTVVPAAAKSVRLPPAKTQSWKRKESPTWIDVVPLAGAAAKATVRNSALSGV